MSSLLSLLNLISPQILSCVIRIKYFDTQAQISPFFETPKMPLNSYMIFSPTYFPPSLDITSPLTTSFRSHARERCALNFIFSNHISKFIQYFERNREYYHGQNFAAFIQTYSSPAKFIFTTSDLIPKAGMMPTNLFFTLAVKRADTYTFHTLYHCSYCTFPGVPIDFLPPEKFPVSLHTFKKSWAPISFRVKRFAQKIQSRYNISCSSSMAASFQFACHWRDRYLDTLSHMVNITFTTAKSKGAKSFGNIILNRARLRDGFNKFANIEFANLDFIYCDFYDSSTDMALIPWTSPYEGDVYVGLLIVFIAIIVLFIIQRVSTLSQHKGLPVSDRVWGVTYIFLRQSSDSVQQADKGLYLALLFAMLCLQSNYENYFTANLTVPAKSVVFSTYREFVENGYKLVITSGGEFRAHVEHDFRLENVSSSFNRTIATRGISWEAIGQEKFAQHVESGLGPAIIHIIQMVLLHWRRDCYTGKHLGTKKIWVDEFPPGYFSQLAKISERLRETGFFLVWRDWYSFGVTFSKVAYYSIRGEDSQITFANLIPGFAVWAVGCGGSIVLFLMRESNRARGSFLGLFYNPRGWTFYILRNPGLK
ncbi:hypothetical protein Fcan01_17584 [Folsomia candida]|uniref:Ionotropic glutamate receptor C-terminal domain-containing protein n=1 Tax=Folsomia candida TaxID=158441 RepID=A0A226DR85_FOLCA|nr:hypothetical protein Fcan01_17584 [Folsomia candida]